MRSRALLFAVWAAIAAVSLPTAVVRAQSPAGPWQVEVRELLSRRAAAVASRDERAFVATMAEAPQSFKRDRLTWFRRTKPLPVGVYRLDYTGEELGELTLA